MIANYHTHTRWCRHGTGEIEEYIMQAIHCGLDTIAITEHVPLPGDPDDLRMQFDEFPLFDKELNQAILKYQGKINVIKGFECEYFPDKIEYYQMLRNKYGYKLLVLGQHRSIDDDMNYFFLTSSDDVLRYADDVCKGISSGLFDFLAHPDMVMARYKVFDDVVETAMRQIFSQCEKYRLPVEINANGERDNRGYPCRQVWKIAAEYDLDCIVGSDAHEVENLVTPSIKICEDMAAEFGLRLLSKLPL